MHGFPISRRSHLPNLLLVLTLHFLPNILVAQPTNSTKPNIIFIMADDLGYEALACNGNDINKTPNLDRLAREGMRFTHAYATPLCTPTRVQVMTGKYNHRNYIGFGLLDKNQMTFGDLLTSAGYETAVAGKWQLLGNEKQQKLAGGKIGSYPNEVGFDNYCLWQVETLGSRYKDPTITHTTGTETYPGQYGPDIISDFAVSFIEENRDKPFFLYYPMILTHAPYEPTPDTPGFQTLGGKESKDNKYFPDLVAYMDKTVGKVVKKVDELGLTTNTLILFTGDNGTGKGTVSIVDGREVSGGKGTTTRYGTHVPLLAYWPDTIKDGQVNENLVDFTDFLPTFMEVAGASLPTDFLAEGISFRSQLVGEKADVRDHVFCYYSPQWGNDKTLVWAHDKTWKLYHDNRFYNIAEDPAEAKPLAEESLTPIARTQKKKLKALLEKHLQEKP